MKLRFRSANYIAGSEAGVGVWGARLGFLLALIAGCSSELPTGGGIGYVEADWRFVTAPQSGWIVQQLLQEGDELAYGNVLFVLDSATEEAALAAAESRYQQAQAEAKNNKSGAREPEIRVLEAQLGEAQARLDRVTSERKRIQPLVAKGIEPGSRGERVEGDYQAALAGVQAAEEAVAVARLPARDGILAAGRAAEQAAAAAVTSARIRLDERTIRARYTGHIEDVFVHQGEFASAGQAVLAVLPVQGLLVRFFVPQQELPAIAVGRRVQVIADGVADALTAKITRIATEAEFTPPVIYSEKTRAKLVFLVEARFAETVPLAPGVPVDVDWSSPL